MNNVGIKNLSILESVKIEAYASIIEALPLFSLLSPRAGYWANVTGLGLKCYAVTQPKYQASSFEKIYTLFITVLYVSNPLLGTKVASVVAGFTELNNMKEHLHYGSYGDAAQSLLFATADFAYAAALITLSPQIIAISLVAQTTFSLYRAYQLKLMGKDYHAIINLAIAYVNGRSAFARRNDLMASSEQYKDAFRSLQAHAINGVEAAKQAVTAALAA